VKPKGKRITLMGSGAILTEVVKAAAQLAEQGIASDVFSVTSWSELGRDGMARDARLLAGEDVPDAAFVTQQLAHTQGPILAATDYVRAVPETIRAYIPEGRRYVSLGTDGFGRSDTRAALRAYFHVDAASIVQAALQALKA
jgi:pyruvate dehydrogenase E1 component